jgi:hypothetical protein
MNGIYFVGMKFKVSKLSKDEFRLVVFGERVYITFNRSNLERTIREQYGLKEKHHPKTARKLY